VQSQQAVRGVQPFGVFRGRRLFDQFDPLVVAGGHAQSFGRSLVVGRAGDQDQQPDVVPVGKRAGERGDRAQRVVGALVGVICHGGEHHHVGLVRPADLVPGGVPRHRIEWRHLGHRQWHGVHRHAGHTVQFGPGGRRQRPDLVCGHGNRHGPGVVGHGDDVPALRQTGRHAGAAHTTG